MDYSKMTDDEFFTLIEKKYGSNWELDEIRKDDSLYSEYIKRVSTGV